MTDTVKQLLKGAGYSDGIIQDVSAEKLPEDFDIASKISTIESNNKERYFKLFENETGEDSFAYKVTGLERSKLLATTNNEFKKMGVPLEDIKELPLHEKLKFSMDFLMKGINEKLTEKDKGATEDVKKLQQDLLDKDNAYNKLIADQEIAIKDVNDSAQKNIVGSKFNAFLKTTFSNIPSDRIITKKHSESIGSAIDALFKSQYDPFYEENGDLIVYKKGTKQRPTGIIDGKDDFLPIDHIYRELLKKEGYWNESNGNGNNNKDGNVVEDIDNKDFSKQSTDLLNFNRKFARV